MRSAHTTTILQTMWANSAEIRLLPSFKGRLTLLIASSTVFTLTAKAAPITQLFGGRVECTFGYAKNVAERFGVAKLATAETQAPKMLNSLNVNEMNNGKMPKSKDLHREEFTNETNQVHI